MSNIKVAYTINSTLLERIERAAGYKDLLERMVYPPITIELYLDGKQGGEVLKILEEHPQGVFDGDCIYTYKRPLNSDERCDQCKRYLQGLSYNIKKIKEQIERDTKYSGQFNSYLKAHPKLSINSFF